MFKSLKESFSFPWKDKKHGGNKKSITRKITLGICAMDKKTKSKPMKEILSRLPEDLIEVHMFGNDCIVNEPVEAWPQVEVLIAFYSTGFPTEKALEYIKLRKPFLINDLSMESTLKDRRKVYQTLESIGIDVPFHVFVNREEGKEDLNIVEEFDEYIVVNGQQINKPLVEKPVDAEDHNIYIYYPMSAGGGSKRLFRKVDDRSSEFYPTVHEIRREGSYIYEEFVITQGTDVKVYTVGPQYGHAEARKSPVVDGRVKRYSDGKEVRYPVILSPTEKDMARKIVETFRQTVCGFDILRVQGKSYCCDVNGFSFVKNSRKYYEDAAQILADIMTRVVRPYSSAPTIKNNPAASVQLSGQSSKLKMIKESSELDLQSLDLAPSPTLTAQNLEGHQATSADDKDRPPSPTERSEADSVMSYHYRRYESEELRCVIAVFRHGDRTPKQKIKVIVTDSKYLDYYHSYAKTPKKDLKVKSKSGLVRFLDVTRDILSNQELSPELKRKLTQIRDVLERWEISGINRKLQMKPQKWDEDEAKEAVAAPAEPVEGGDCPIEVSVDKPKRSGLATELLVILKWGGDLTPLGREQAEQLGERFRTENYPDHENGGVLRLHATYRHDLKIKASDEGRVMKTAAAFTKGLLELEGQLTPILASLVTVEEKNRQMLDRGGNFEMKEEMDRCKKHLNLLQVDQDLSDDIINQIVPGCSDVTRLAFKKLGNPLQALKRMHCLVQGIASQLETLCARDFAIEDIDRATMSGAETPNYCTETGKQSPLDAFAVGFKATESSEKFEYPPSADGNGGATPVHNEGEANPIVGLYLNETFDLMLDRWEKLHKDFYSAKTSQFDLTKVPEVYDMIRYDIIHNRHLNLAGMEELFELARVFETCVVPQEYGVDRADKRYIGSKMCGALLEKIKYDLSVAAKDESASGKEDPLLYMLDHSHADDLAINSLGRCVRSRLYFTSESHLHTILNVFRYPKPGSPFSISREGIDILEQITDVSYLSQIVIRLFEDRTERGKFTCELSFSPGTTNDPWNDRSNAIAPYIYFDRSIALAQMIGCLDDVISQYHSTEKHSAASEQVEKEAAEVDIDLLPLESSKSLSKLEVPLSPINMIRSQSISVSMDDLSSEPSSDRWEHLMPRDGYNHRLDRRRVSELSLPRRTTVSRPTPKKALSTAFSKVDQVQIPIGIATSHDSNADTRKQEVESKDEKEKSLNVGTEESVL